MNKLTVVGGTLLLGMLLGTAQFAAAQQVALSSAGSSDRSIAVLPESKVWVQGTSTVRSYRCEATQIRANVTGEPGSAASVAELQGVVKGVNVTIPVAQMRCGDNTMDGHMRRALQAETHPEIRFRLNSHQVSGQGEQGTVRMNGRLSIAGQEKPVQITAEAVQGPNGTFRIQGTHRFQMTEFGVRPPTLMMGTMRVHDPVVVHFDMVLRP